MTIKPRPDGGYDGVMQSPDQTPAPIPLNAVRMEGGVLSFAVNAIRGSYAGRWDYARKAWVGEWRQATALPLPLVLTSGKPDVPVIAGLDGDWTGTIMPAGATIRLILHVKTDVCGTVVSMDSPDQLAYGLPLPSLTRKGQAVSFGLSGNRFEGTLSADGHSIDGSWKGPNFKGPLVFTARPTQTAAPRRPQTPHPPFPYRTEEVTVDSAPGVKLAGTLTLPAGKGPFPAVVLISGSGAQDRDETILAHKPFAVIADRLTRDGVAVLRMDDRGFARSTGNFAAATDDDFAADTAADVAFLRQRADIDPARIGLIGHSEGGLVAPKVAVRDPRIAFIVLMAGPGVPLSQVLAAQRARLGPAMGQAPERTRRIQALTDHAVLAMRGSSDEAEARSRAIKIMRAEAGDLFRSDGQAEGMAMALSSGWMRDLIDYDPRPTLAKVKCPILALNGAKDGQVPAEQNLPAIRTATAGNPDVTLVELPGLNHLFQTAKTGAPGEYADIEETVAPIALERMANWIRTQVKNPSGFR
ncbi:alpha/beta hydrolase [Sphingomonas sp. CARO-RG-8B-R24-01]|uniref:alpha/beta hydrolase family protein n=1 Tax=Sphingomonas sp. CARO-RG-8B-R24-01 TaxID=2914831 RepID=UPI001F59F175